MSNLPTPINLVDTETIQWTGDNSNPRNAYANVATADASTHGAVLMTGDFGNSGESPAVVGITGILFDRSIAPTEDYQAPQFVADGVSDAGIAFGHLKFGHLSGGVDARSTTTETVDKSSFAHLVSFADGSPAADVAVALDSTVNAHFWCFVRNATASNALNFTPSTGSINTSTLASNSAAALYFDGTNWTLVTFGGAGGLGTVTSVALTVPSWLSVSGSPITTSGTLAVTAASGQTANQVLATPNGSTGSASLRALVAADIPNIAESQVTNLTTDLAAKVPTSRTISTTAPLTGGGDLSANRTLDISNFTGDSGSGGAKGAVPAPAAGDAAAGKFLKANGAWVTPSGASGGSRGFSLSSISVATDAAPHVRAGTAGTLAKVTAILRRTITATLTMVVYLDGVAACTVNVPSSTAVDAIIAVTSFSASTITADSIFKLAITASDSSIDPQGVVTIQMFWS
jgi:hypothetical protein